ncbi:RagB/SusD family nutrient uptake outer membrane protein [Flammeovirga sp. MY04]|uniref:RagB/SusD family nutrient uptake outer membrane protein n=1 Tax=Flammeovirga sp. MY04 TaxID=1191459 RepID=UPI000825D6C0|nr:RagB/SusD family nutrient uptake outer membrane protein [Flammeovirga sp. MY04]ANQ47444.2 RagB/SusD family nutrient uptake outer membrane protein [Flammeovirga sp. MY04]
MSKIRYIKLFLVISVLLGSCTNFLEEINPNEISKDNFWKDLDQSQLGLNSVYAALFHHDLLAIQEEAVRSDLGYPGYGRPSPQSNFIDIAWYNQTFNAGTESLNKKWEALYTGIFRANQVIEGLNNLKPNLAEKDYDRWDEQMGQALFFRGLYHFYLHSSYNNGRVIIRDYVPVTKEDYQKSVSSSEEVIAFFRNDLKTALEMLPSSYSGASNVGKVTKGTASTILGTSYLYQEQYDSAIYYFDDVMNNPDYGYELVYDTDLLFTHAGEHNKESIFEISFSIDQRKDQGVWDEKGSHNRLARAFSPAEMDGGRNVIPSAWIAYAYKTEPMDQNDPRNFVIDADGVSKLRNTTLRASSMVALVQDVNTPYYQQASVPQGTPFSNYEYAYYKKYTNFDIYESEMDSPLGVFASGKNITVNRLADVYLMYAEAQLKGNGNVEEALKYINRIRHRWALRLLGTASEFPSSEHDNTAYSVTSLMNHIMYVEKPLEMSVEGYSTRTIDLRRWDISKQRYSELAQEVYHLGDYEKCWVDEEGNLKDRLLSTLEPGAKPADNNGIDIKDFQQAAANYNKNLHAYLPIPLSEIQNNPTVGQ